MTITKPNSWAFSAVAITDLAPTGSTHTGFSANTCLRAATAAARCSGRKKGGVARITRSTPEAITFWKASKPTKHISSGISCPFSFRLTLQLSIRSLKVSPSAVICRFFPALRKLIAAPVPRPPQPITPAFRTGPSGASSSHETVGIFILVRAQPDKIEGTTIPAAPTVAALFKKFRLEILDFFILNRFKGVINLQFS